MVKLKLQSKYSIVIILVALCTQLHRVIPNFVKTNTPSSKQILDTNGKIIRLTLSSDEKFRLWTDFQDISDEFKKAIQEKEDKFFVFHFGINPVSFVRASIKYIFNKKGPGASTITMQLARLYYHLKTRQLGGKLKQILYATLLELSLSKEEIFEAYLNLIPMGKNIEGISTASKYYLGKSSKKLNEFEVALFTLIPQSPKRYSYIGKKNFNELSKLMAPLLPLYTRSNIEEFLKDLKLRNKRPFLAPHFSELVLSRISSSKAIGNSVYTSLDLGLQNSIDGILKKYINDSKSKGLHNATSLIVDSRTGEIVSYIGSKDFFNKEIHGQVDGILAKRSPGSTLKPFIYGLAFDQGLYTPQSIVFDSPLAFRTPENYDRTYKGPMSIEEALVTSRNIPAVFVNSKLNSPNLFDFLEMSGVKINHGVKYYGSSIALGALEMSSLELAKLYVLLAENGQLKEISPFSVNKKNENTYLLSPEASILVKDILRKHQRPDFKRMAQFTNNIGDVYWKTGTSFGFRDAWATGIWGNYVIINWVGDFKSTSNPYLVGSLTAAPLFFKIIDFLRSKNLYSIDDDIKHNFSNKLTNVKVCTVSGKIPNEFCPHRKSTLYIPHVSPIEKCKIHRRISISNKTGLRVCPKYTGKSFKKVYEFFNTEKIQLYQRFGLKLSLPPKFEKICSESIQNNLIGIAPQIISPKIGFTYIIEKDQNSTIIPLKVKSDSDVNRLTWYIDGELVKKSIPGNPSSLILKAGIYQLKVIDDKGRIGHRVLKLENSL